MTTVATGWSHHGYSGAYECAAAWSAMGTVRMPDLRCDALMLLRAPAGRLLPSPRPAAAALRPGAARTWWPGTDGGARAADPRRDGALSRRRPSGGSPRAPGRRAGPRAG